MTVAPGAYASVSPDAARRHERSTSSPAVVKAGSKPPIFDSAALVTAMLHPHSCARLSSPARTSRGRPGAAAIAAARAEVAAGAKFGPDAAATSRRVIVSAK